MTLAFPKPRKRIVDKVAIEAYRQTHPHCEVQDHRECWYYAGVEIHHLIKRSKGGQGGDDVPENLIALCTAHHTGRVGIHAESPPYRRWFSRWGAWLLPEARAKFLARFPELQEAGDAAG